MAMKLVCIASVLWVVSAFRHRTHRWACFRVLAAERGPSAGKEWFWLRGNPKLAPSHLLPDFTAGSSSSGSSGPQFHGSWHTSGSRLWDAGNGMWWEEGWKLGAVCLHSWPAHREKLRALAVDPWERLLVTAGEEDVAPLLQSLSSLVASIVEYK